MVKTRCSTSSPAFCTQLNQTQMPSRSEATLIYTLPNCWHLFAGDSKAHTFVICCTCKVKPYVLTACLVDRKHLPSWSDNDCTFGLPAAASYPNNCVTEKQGLLNSLWIDYLLLGSIQSANEILPSMEDQWDQGCIHCKGLADTALWMWGDYWTHNE